MGRRNRKSKRRMNSLFMTMLLTAILLVMSTYAWFSANREVQIDLFRAKVSAAEGLQISLDGEKWGSSVKVSKKLLDDLGDKNEHQFPDELVPVSTDGTMGGSDMNFWFGDVKDNGTKLDGVSAVSASTGGKYIAFDCYFKNSSSQESDQFQLNGGSYIKLGTDDPDTANVNEAGATGTGLEYSVRAGLMLYGNTAVLTADGGTVRDLTAGDAPKSFIWEPNYNKHIAEVVTNDHRITAGDTVFNTLALTSAATGNLENIDVNTVAENSKLIEQKTFKSPETVGSATTMTSSDDNSNLTLKGTAIMKTRIYIWLEGQDPDCNDTASTGKYIDVLLKFTKPAPPTSNP